MQNKNNFSSFVCLPGPNITVIICKKSNYLIKKLELLDKTINVWQNNVIKVVLLIKVIILWHKSASIESSIKIYAKSITCPQICLSPLTCYTSEAAPVVKPVERDGV